MNPHLEFLLSTVYDGALALKHREDLEKSGLGKDIIRAHYIRSVPLDMIPRLLGFDIPAIKSALLFPFSSPAGGFMDHIRMKLFPTVVKVTRDGTTHWIAEEDLTPEDVKHETMKYSQRKDSAQRLYFVRTCLREVLDGAAPLWLVEGEKKALHVAQRGLPTIGFCGVEGWHVKGERRLLDDFAALRLRGRIIEVLPDGDYKTNPNVQRAVQHLGAALTAHGARPRVVLLPSESPR